MSPIGVPVSREAWDHLSSLEGFERALREIATAALQTWKDVDTYTLRNIIISHAWHIHVFRSYPTMREGLLM